MCRLLRWRDFAPNNEGFHVASYQLTDYAQPDLHTHDFAEIFWISEGKGLHHGQNENQSLEKGCLSIIAPEVKHRFEGVGEMTLINLAFPASTYALLQSVYSSVSLTRGESLPAAFRVNESGLAELNRALNELVGSPSKDVFLWRFIGRCMCVLSPLQNTLSEEAPAWLRHACHRITEPRHAREGMKGFVKLASRSPEHVSRATRKWTGRSPREIVQEARLNLVSRELALSDKRKRPVGVPVDRADPWW